MEMWQQEWSHGQSDSAAAWTRSLVKNVVDWVDRRHGEVDYHLSQALSGHGCFQAYLFKIKKAATPNCICGEGVDDVEHTIFACPRFQDRRFHLEGLLDEKIEKDNLVELMLRGKLN